MKSFTAEVEFELTNTSSGPSRVRKGMADIDPRGMFISTKEPIRAGARIAVRFELPGAKDRVVAVAQCNVVNKGRPGFRFISLDDYDRVEIEAHIAGLQNWD